MPAKGGDDVANVKQTLQAVVLADSFANAFKPLTVRGPKVLLPIAHAPALEYVLEWLASQGVEETFVVACAHADAIEAYLHASGWSQGSGGAGGERDGSDGRRGRDGDGTRGGMTTKCIASSNCISAGEALRLIDHKHVIRSDFVLVSGDVVTNMDL